MALKQANRLLNFDCQLGPDALLLTGFAGSEEFSRLFKYQLQLISDDAAIKPQSLVGTAVGWSVELADQSRRHWHGYVSQMAIGDTEFGRRNYRLEVVPWLWFLTQTSDCKIFQDKTVPDIIDEVLGDYGFADYTPDFTLSHKKWEYCVQYRETDFNFLARLMEQEGIFYYFKHSQGAHKLIVSDNPNAYYGLPESKVDLPTSIGSGAVKDHLTSWQRRFEFVPGKYAQQDYNFTTPSTDLKTNTNTVVDLPDISKYEIYDYPGEYPDKGVGGGETKLRMQAEETRHEVIHATSLCKTFQVGGKFSVGVHPDASEEGAEAVVASVHHAASEPLALETGSRGERPASDYRNTLTCLPGGGIFRPVRTTPKPIISGIQTAIVTGPAGEEIYPDEYGRVKCQFHWDRYGKKDDKSSCWIRVSQIHAGAGFGSMHVPRIGEEVVVSFLEGDPDRPLITGRVYHAENMPPWALPANKTQSGIKTRSSKGGSGDNANIIRFEDLKDGEQLFIHAEKNQDIEVENDETHWVGNDRTKTIDHNETTHVKHNRTETVGNNEVILIQANRTETVDKDEKITIHGNRTEVVDKDETITIHANRKETVDKDETITIQQNRSETVGKNETVNVGENRSHTIGKNDTLSVGKVLNITAGDQISLTTGKASIVMKKDGTIVITGKDITVDGKGKINVKATKDVVMKGKKILQN